MKVDIQNNREEVFTAFQNLDVNTQPLFGKMSPQHVVEHLAFAISLSTGSGPQKQFTSEEEGNAVKSKMIYTDSPMPEGIKNPLISEEPPALKFGNMNEAIEQLKAEFEKFDALSSDTKMIHPRMGSLEKKEWAILHNKHITHHLRQFGL